MEHVVVVEKNKVTDYKPAMKRNREAAARARRPADESVSSKAACAGDCGARRACNAGRQTGRSRAGSAACHGRCLGDMSGYIALDGACCVDVRVEDRGCRASVTVAGNDARAKITHSCAVLVAAEGVVRSGVIASAGST